MVTDDAVTRAANPVASPANPVDPAANTVTVLGGPTALIRLAGWTLLTDPTFDAAGTEYQDGPVRLRKTADPALEPAQLPALDAVLVSHTQHRDNLDTTGRALASGASQVFTTVAGATDLGGAAVGLEPWQTRTLSMPGRTTLNITAVPARHGPAGSEGLTGPVTGFLLHTDEGSAPTVYVSGDTVDLDAMSALADRHRVDVALLHLGAAGFEELGDVRLSLTGDRAVEARRLLGDPLVVAVHAEGWAHYTEDRDHARQAFDTAGVPLLWPVPGRPVTLPDPHTADTSPSAAGALARSFYAAVDARPFDPERVRAHLAEDFRDHNRPTGFGDDVGDRDVLVMLLTALAAAFPDGRHTVERLTPVGTDEALLYWRFTGTHTGTAFLGAPAAGARVDFVGTDLFTAGDGVFTAQRHVEDLLTLTSQLSPDHTAS
ncbi:ester cyclase [Streptomyces sp. NPDC014892]|uniref:ester cyclase n=1 Tax=Streptomyces sp. NPDC014892 TaxID=3364930 RepID=UPI00370316B8